MCARRIAGDCQDEYNRISTVDLTIAGSSGSSEDISLDIVEGSTYSYSIKGLTQDSSDTSGYSVRVTAKNAVAGYGNPCDPVILKPRSPPTAPLQVELDQCEGVIMCFFFYF